MLFQRVFILCSEATILSFLPDFVARLDLTLSSASGFILQSLTAELFFQGGMASMPSTCLTFCFPPDCRPYLLLFPLRTVRDTCPKWHFPLLPGM